MGHPHKDSLPYHVLNAMEGIEGLCSIELMIALVGNKVSASSAATAGRKLRRNALLRGKKVGNRYKLPLEELGRKHNIRNTLYRLYREGKILRVGYGVYAPLHYKNGKIKKGR